MSRPSPIPPLRRAAAATAFALLAATAGAAPQDARPNDPSTDPYTAGDPERMAPAGVLSLGGFEFGTTDTAEVDRYLAVNDIKWIETNHFEIGFALGPYKVKQEERKQIAAELEALALKLPEVDPRTKVLDPWLRTHMYAQRCEALYQRFLDIARVDDSVFPGPTRPRLTGPAYRGEGPHLGHKGKFEVLVLPTEASSVSYLSKYFGLGIKRTQRWNVVERDSLMLVMHTQQGRLTDDGALHGHLAFNLAHLFFDAYEHYSYDTPIWLHEGLAHYMERSIDPRYNSFDGSEGSVPEMTRKWKWEAEVKKLVAGGDAPRLAELVRYNDYGEMDLDDHYATWSMVDFLVKAHPEALAGLLAGLKGLLNAEGYPDGGNLPDVHRELFRELLSMSYADFDAAWREWVKESY